MTRKMSNIKFSILIPAYKRTFLKACIDSILAQSYRNFEIIIVNDASPQDLDAVISKYKDDRIIYHKNEVGFGAMHVVGNWNKCLEYATGDYTICMGDDDKLLPNCLDEYKKVICSYPNLDIYHGMAMMIDENDTIVDVQAPRPVLESIYSIMYYRWFKKRRQFIGDWLFNTKALKEKGGFTDLPYAWESDDCSSYLACGNKGVANTQVPVFLYRVSSQTISSNTSNTKDKLVAHVKALDVCRSLIDDRKPKNELDLFYFNKIKDGYISHLSKAYAIDIGEDILNNPFRLCYWILNKNKYSIPSKSLPLAIIHAAKEFIKRH